MEGPRSGFRDVWLSALDFNVLLLHPHGPLNREQNSVAPSTTHRRRTEEELQCNDATKKAIQGHRRTLTIACANHFERGGIWTLCTVPCNKVSWNGGSNWVELWDAAHGRRMPLRLQPCGFLAR